MHEDRNSLPQQHNIRPAGQISALKSVSVTGLNKCPANNYLGNGVASSDTRHHGASFIGRNDVYHGDHLSGTEREVPTEGTVDNDERQQAHNEAREAHMQC